MHGFFNPAPNECKNSSKEKSEEEVKGKFQQKLDVISRKSEINF